MESTNCLDSANKLTAADRNEAYDHPWHNFSRCARLWEVLLGMPPESISPEKVGEMMIAVKMAREMFRHSDDNLVDIAGYARTIEMCRDYRRGLNEPVSTLGNSRVVMR